MSNSRDGSYNSPSNISSPTESWSQTVDAPVYAEPLYFDGSVFVATENNTVYSLSSANGSIQWSDHLGTPADSVAPPYECNNSTAQAPDIQPTIGITGTPVIDSSTDTFYVASLIYGTGFVLFALNTTSGQQISNTTIDPPNFHYLPEEQRGALTLANGFVYVPFGGYSWDCLPPGPIGWVVAIPTSLNGTEYTFGVPTTVEADIWAPEGISVDSSGTVYLVTGDSNNQSFDLGNSVIKLSPDLSFTNSTTNFFAATNWEYTDTNDLDLGSTGATLLPGGLIFSIGKDGIGYLLNASNLGGIGGELYSAVVCGSYGAWGGTSYAGGTIYVPCGDGVHALSLTTGSQPKFATLWNATGFWAGPPIITAGAVWSAGITNGVLYALSPENGSIIYQKTLIPFEHFATPSAGGGLLFVAANQTVYAINMST